jgi:hypothetical protein
MLKIAKLMIVLAMRPRVMISAANELLQMIKDIKNGSKNTNFLSIFMNYFSFLS